MESKLTIDKMSITAKMDSSLSSKVNDFLSSGTIESEYFYTPNNFMYQHNFKLFDGSFFQYGKSPKNEDNVRFEFNPNKYDWNLNHKLLSRVKYPTVTRLDFAVDFFGVDFADKSQYKIESLTARKEIEYRSRSQRMETRYIGSPKSDNFIRLYDKSRELKKNFDEDVEHEFDIDVEEQIWRVEAVVKDFTVKNKREMVTIDDKTKQVVIKKMNVEEDALFVNPFKVVIWKKGRSDFSELKIQERAMIYYLKDHPEEWDNLSPKSRKKYESYVYANEWDYLDELQPAVIFEQEKNRLKEEVWSILSPAIRNSFNPVTDDDLEENDKRQFVSMLDLAQMTNDQLRNL